MHLYNSLIIIFVVQYIFCYLSYIIFLLFSNILLFIFNICGIFLLLCTQKNKLCIIKNDIKSEIIF